MVAGDRDLKLRGYEVFRVGGPARFAQAGAEAAGVEVGDERAGDDLVEAAALFGGEAVKVGGEGEIVVRGSLVMAGYYAAGPRMWARRSPPGSTKSPVGAGAVVVRGEGGR
jgi:hypothetical protein